MALFKPYRLTTVDQLNSLPIVEGQFIVVEATGNVYFDKDATHRIDLAKDGYTISISGNTLSLIDSSSTVVSTATIPSVVNAVVWNNEEYPDINTFDCYNKSQIDAMLVNMTGADGTNPGVRGFVPAPAATDNVKYLKGDGTWSNPINTEYLTIAATGWSTSAPYTKTISVTGITSSNIPYLYPVYSSTLSTRNTEKEEYAKIDLIDSNNGSVTLTCDEAIPTIALNVRLEWR